MNSASSSQTSLPRAAALAAITAVAIYLCYLITAPFLPGITWAIALAIIGIPLHNVILRILPNRNWAAGVATAIVVLVIAIPVSLVAIQLGHETTRAVAIVRDRAANDQLREDAAKIPYLGEWIDRIESTEIEQRAREAVGQIANRSLGMIEGAFGGILQALVAIFVMFFCFRDRHYLMDEVRRLMPLSSSDSSRVLKRAADAVHATVYGTLLTAAIQGVTGGLLFWALGLPAPVLWGAIMFALGVLPFVGAFLVWVPATIYLVHLDRWGAAIALVAWGLIMAGPVCNYIYAVAAGDRMRLHPVPTLISFIGGLAVFGVSGMVIGPCILAVTVALLDIWRTRSSDTAVESRDGLILKP